MEINYTVKPGDALPKSNPRAASPCDAVTAMLKAPAVDNLAASARLVVCRSCPLRKVDRAGDEYCEAFGCHIVSARRSLRNLVAHAENLPPGKPPFYGCKHPKRGRGEGWPLPAGARAVAPAGTPAKPVEAPQPSLLYTAAGKPLDLANLYKGRSAFLILGGPSFGKLDAAKLRRPGVLTCGVNNSVKSFRPDLWTCVDGADHFLRSIWLDPRILKLAPETLKGAKVFDSDAWQYTSRKVADCPATVFYKRHCGFVAETFLSEASVCWGNSESQGGGRSVMLAAIRLLYYLGVRRVFLLGCDFKMDAKTTYHFDQKRAPGSVSGNNGTYSKLCERFAALRPHAEASGLTIKNCNPESGLRAFDFCTFDEALAEVETEFGNINVATERTADLYDTKKPPMKKPLPHSPAWVKAPAIPKHAHFAWLGSPLPKVAAQLLEDFKRINPAWAVNLITAPPPEMDTDLQRAFYSCDQLCQRADLLRLDALRREGGCAFDLDFVWLRPLDELLHFDHFVSQGTDSRLFNGAVGFAKGSLALESVLSLARKRISQGPPFKRTDFGPRLYSAARALATPPVNIMPRHYFYPFYKHETAVGFLRSEKAAREEMIDKHAGRYSDGVWPFAVQLFGFPTDAMPAGVGRSSWASVEPKEGERVKITLLIPSHKRAEQCARTIRSALDTSTTGDVVAVVGVDETDPEPYEQTLGNLARVFRFKTDCVGDALRELWRAVREEAGEAGVVGMLADDLRFDSPAWDKTIAGAARTNPVAMIHADDGIRGGTLATHPFLTRRFLRAVGDELPVGNYRHLYADSELSEIATKAGAACYLPDVKITHLHFSNGLSPMDVTYRRHDKHRAADREEFHRRRADRAALVAAVSAARLAVE